MISVRECFRKRLDDDKILQANFDSIMEKHGKKFEYFLTELGKGGQNISEDELRAHEEEMDIPIFARVPYTHIGYMFDMKDVFELDGGYYIEGPVIFGMHYGDIFAGLEEEDYEEVNKAIYNRRCTVHFEEEDVLLFKILKGDLGL